MIAVQLKQSAMAHTSRRAETMTQTLALNGHFPPLAVETPTALTAAQAGNAIVRQAAPTIAALGKQDAVVHTSKLAETMILIPAQNGLLQPAEAGTNTAAKDAALARALAAQPTRNAAQTRSLTSHFAKEKTFTRTSRNSLATMQAQLPQTAPQQQIQN